MRLFGIKIGGVKLRDRIYDSARDGKLEHVGDLVASGVSERIAINNLEKKAEELGATIVFGLLSRSGGLYYYTSGSAYRPSQKK